MELYAYRVQELQHDLGLPISSFDDIEMSATSFLWEIAQEENNNQEQEVSDAEYQIDRYEQERFTDEYSEYVQDDENKDDRFTYAYDENFTDQLIYINIYLIFDVTLT